MKSASEVTELNNSEDWGFIVDQTRATHNDLKLSMV